MLPAWLYHCPSSTPHSPHLIFLPLDSYDMMGREAIVARTFMGLYTPSYMTLLTHSSIHPPTHPTTHSLTHPPIHLPTHSPTFIPRRSSTLRVPPPHSQVSPQFSLTHSLPPPPLPQSLPFRLPPPRNVMGEIRPVSPVHERGGRGGGRVRGRMS